MRPDFRISAVVMLGAILAISGCATSTRMWVGNASAGTVEPQKSVGERVVIVLRSGRTLNCRITGVDAEFLYGCSTPVALQNIAEVRTWKIEGQRVQAVLDVRPGDEVTVILRSGDVKSFRVERIDSNSIYGDTAMVAIIDIDRMTIRRESLGGYGPEIRRAAAGAYLILAAIAYFVARGSAGSD